MADSLADLISWNEESLIEDGLQLLKGVRRPIVAGPFYTMNEEDLWIGEGGEARDFFQGVLQIAVALHHWRNGNYGGAVTLLTGGGKLLNRVNDVCMWVDVARLIADANRMREALEELGKEKMTELDNSLVPRLWTVAVKN